MKKALIVIAILLGVAGLVAVVGSVYAQTTPPTESSGENPSGVNRHGMWGRNAGQIQPYIIAALAEGLDLTVEEFQSRLDEGERVIDIAIEQGLTLADYRDLKESTRLTAIDRALADGVITQEQADRLKEKPAFGRGFGRGMRGEFEGRCPGMTP